MSNIIRFSKVNVSDVYKYSKNLKDIINTFDEVNVGEFHSYIVKECKRIEKTIFMRRKTKDNLKIKLIKSNVNSLIDEFSYTTMVKFDNTFFLPYYTENSKCTLEKFLEESILKVTDECIPRDSIFKFNYYTSDEVLRDNYLNMISTFKPNEYRYEEYLTHILINVMSRYIFLLSTEKIENEKTVPLSEKIKEIYFDEEEKEKYDSKIKTKRKRREFK